MDDGAAADLLGVRGVWRDPIWGVLVELSALERALLRTWWVRRLAHVAHAGAAAWTTTQSYSRLEHSLGVLALTAHFTPDDGAARAAALLHDIGHLPLSHTFEGVGGLEHHELGRRRMAELEPLLREHGLDAAEVEGAWSAGSARRRAAGTLGLDHLDSFVRSGRSHGRLGVTPAALLRRLRLVDGDVDADRATAALLADLAVGETASQLSAANVMAVTVARRIAEVLLQDVSAEAVAVLTDVEFWGLALQHPRTRALAESLRRTPDDWTVRRLDGDEPPPPGALVYFKERLYAVVPTVDGSPGPALTGLPVPPVRFAVEQRAA